MTDRVILLRPAAQCPRCGCGPPLRIPSDEVDKHRGQHPGEFVMAVKCPDCEAIYAINVAAYLGAA